MFRIAFDANDLAANGSNYSLHFEVSKKDITPVADQLYDGLRVIIYMEGELEMEAILQFDKQHEVWTAAPILGTVKYYDEDSTDI